MPPINNPQTNQPQPIAPPPVPPVQQPQIPEQPPISEDPGKTLGIVGLILAFILPLFGLIISLVARSKSKKAGHKNVLALIGIIVSIVLMALALLLVGLSFTSSDSNQKSNTTSSISSEPADQDDLDNLAIAIDAYYDKKGGYPPTLDDLRSEKDFDEGLLNGKRYDYTVSPSGCKANSCSSYTLFITMPDGIVHGKEGTNGN